MTDLLLKRAPANPGEFYVIADDKMRPRLPSIPAHLKLRLSLSKVATRSARFIGPVTRTSADCRDRRGSGRDATNIPAAAVDGVVRPVLVDPRAKAGWVQLKGINPLP